MFDSIFSIKTIDVHFTTKRFLKIIIFSIPKKVSYRKQLHLLDLLMLTECFNYSFSFSDSMETDSSCLYSNNEPTRQT